jgi:hypothetical protein
LVISTEDPAKRVERVKKEYAAKGREGAREWKNQTLEKLAAVYDKMAQKKQEKELGIVITSITEPETIAEKQASKREERTHNFKGFIEGCLKGAGTAYYSRDLGRK